MDPRIMEFEFPLNRVRKSRALALCIFRRTVLIDPGRKSQRKTSSDRIRRDTESWKLEIHPHHPAAPTVVSKCDLIPLVLKCSRSEARRQYRVPPRSYKSRLDHPRYRPLPVK
jgi:hypothetical protein